MLYSGSLILDKENSLDSVLLKESESFCIYSWYIAVLVASILLHTSSVICDNSTDTLPSNDNLFVKFCMNPGSLYLLFKSLVASLSKFIQNANSAYVGHGIHACPLVLLLVVYLCCSDKVLWFAVSEKRRIYHLSIREGTLLYHVAQGIRYLEAETLTFPCNSMRP